jgi:acyl-coenzyme A thioesterase PaaI-like protein
VSPVVLPVVETGPEALFRLGEITSSDDGELRGSMAVGPWLEGAAASVAVLVDDLLGYAIIADLPHGRWSVSAEITLDVLRPLPASGRVQSSARQTHVDGLGGFATGSVTAEDGTPLVLCTQRGRFITAPDGLVEEGAWGGPVGEGDLERLLALRDGVSLPTTDVLANEGGNLHGGISLFASDVVARATAPGLTTASVHITYARAIPIGALLTYRAAVRHGGRSLAVVDVDGLVADRVCTTARVVLHTAPA